MKRKSKVHSLIRSMTMSEKRYFKIFSERHTIGEQNKYVAIFDLLDQQTEENDETLARELRKNRINADYLSADKNYLYRLILRSLNDFHAGRTMNLEVKENLLSIEILFHKGLYHECLKLIEKTESLADECENFQLSIDLLNWKKKCSGYSLGLQKAAEVNQRIDVYVDRLNNLKRITDLYYESNLLQANAEKFPKAEVIKRFRQILKAPELKNEKGPQSFSARILYQLVHSNFYYITDNKEAELKTLQQLVDLLHSSATYAYENPLDYVSIYNRLLSIKKHFPKNDFFGDIRRLNDFAKHVEIRKEVVAQRVFIHCNTHELEYYLLQNDFEAAQLKLKAIEQGMAKQEIEIEPYHLIYFYYLHSITLMFVGQHQKALKFVNRTLLDFKMEDRPQVYLRVELLNAIVHYELGNEELVIGLATQLLKKNTQKEILNAFETELLKSLLKICKKNQQGTKEEIQEFRQLQESIQKIQSKENDSWMVANYNKWLTSKIKRNSVLALYSNK